MLRPFLIIMIGALPTGAFAAGATGSYCSPQRLAYCKSQGMDDNGYGPGWIHNRCKRSPSGTRFESGSDLAVPAQSLI